MSACGVITMVIYLHKKFARRCDVGPPAAHPACAKLLCRHRHSCLHSHLQREVFAEQDLWGCVAESEVHGAGVVAAVAQHGRQAHIADLPPQQQAVTGTSRYSCSRRKMQAHCTQVACRACTSYNFNALHACAAWRISCTFALVWAPLSTTFDDFRSPCNT
jgi:hypothetical protein